MAIRVFIDSDRDVTNVPLSESSGVLSQPVLLRLPQEISHHLKNVLRLGAGRQVTLVARESGQEYLAIISTLSDESVEVSVLEKHPPRAPSGAVRSLLCALPKGSHSDLICEMATQLGVDRIIFWAADRTVVQLKNPADKVERWRRIAESSARQSQRSSVPEVEYVESSKALIESLAGTDEALIVCSLLPEAILARDLAPPRRAVSLIVGPEGDFTADENSAFQNCGASFMSLGNLVLRVETAAICAIATANALWSPKTF